MEKRTVRRREEETKEGNIYRLKIYSLGNKAIQSSSTEFSFLTPKWH